MSAPRSGGASADATLLAPCQLPCGLPLAALIQAVSIWHFAMDPCSSSITISILRRIDKTVIDPMEVSEPTNERRQECHEVLSNCYARNAVRRNC